MSKLCSGSRGHGRGANILVQQSVGTGRALRWRLGGESAGGRRGRSLRSASGRGSRTGRREGLSWEADPTKAWAVAQEALGLGWPLGCPPGSTVESLYSLNDQPLDAGLHWKKAWPRPESFLQLKTVLKEDWQPRATLQQHSHQMGEQFFHSQRAVWVARHADYHEGLGENGEVC